MKPSNTTFTSLVVLLDPTTPAGESGAALASSLVGPGGALHLVVATSGPEAWPFVAFGDSEVVSAAHAARTYLAQVAGRVGHEPMTMTSIDGDDVTGDLSSLVSRVRADAIVVPSAFAARTLATKRRWGAIPCPVIVAPSQPAAA